MHLPFALCAFLSLRLIVRNRSAMAETNKKSSCRIADDNTATQRAPSRQTRRAERAAEAAATSAAAQQSHRRAFAPLQRPTRRDGIDVPTSAAQRSQTQRASIPQPAALFRTQWCSRGGSSWNPRPCSASCPIFLSAIYTYLRPLTQLPRMQCL